MSKDGFAASDVNACRSVLLYYSEISVTLISAKVIPAGQKSPEYCEVVGTITVDIGFKVRMPLDWNNRFDMVGNEGSGGKFNDRNVGNSYLRYTAFEVDDPEHDRTSFDFDLDPARTAKASDIMDADDPDLSAPRASGAKVIHDHHLMGAYKGSGDTKSSDSYE